MRSIGGSFGGSALRAVACGLALLALGLLLASAPLPLAAALVAGSAAAVALLLRPVLGLYALAALVPFGGLGELSLFGLRLSAPLALLGVVLLAWLARMAAHRTVRLHCPAVGWALAAYLGVVLLSLLPAQQLLPAAKAVLKIGAMLALLLLTHNLLAEGSPRALAAALLLGGALQGALGVYQFVAGVGPPGFVLMGRYMRAHGTFGQPNPYAGYLGLVLPMGYAWLLAERHAPLAALRGSRMVPGLLWLAAWPMTALAAAGLALSWSRGALLGTLAGGLLVTLALLPRPSPRRCNGPVGRPDSLRWAVILLAVGALIVILPRLLVLAPAGFWSRLGDTLVYARLPDLHAVEITDENFAIIQRVAHWLGAWRLFERAPWLGVGAGQYALRYPEVSLPRWEQPLGHAHNDLLFILAEGGLLALSAYLAFIASALALAWRTARRSDSAPASGPTRAFGLGALGLLGHMLVHGMFDSVFISELYLLPALLLGAAAACSRRATPAEPTPGARP